LERIENLKKSIVGVIGNPLIIDVAIKQFVFGHYARVLVDLDFSRRVFDEIMVEREGFAFKLAVNYEWLTMIALIAK